MFGKDRKTLVKSLLEKSTAVCGSIQSTIQDEDNIGWVKSKAEGCSQRSCKKVELDATGFSHEFSELLDEDYSEDFTHETQSTDGGKDKPRVSSSRGKAIGSKMPVDSYGCAGHAVVIGLCLSRRSSVGHADTVTRQTEFDFNELQDRDYKYVSSTDERGWLAGGGQRRDPQSKPSDLESGDGDSDKVAAPDRVHLPIIQINAPSAEALNEIVAALARGEIFIPHMAILPGSLTVKGKSPPDLVVPFGCEKNDDANPEDWPNWCLEFLHNQLYDYFAPQGAQWSKRPFQITLARKVKWKTIKHMNKYFARSEDVTQSWREKGPQYLTPQKVLGVTSEEVLRPHGIYLIRNGEPTNYFPPNFEPPYTTNVTRSLIRNVVNKSWDSKHRDWLGEPVPHYRGPIQVISSFIECGNPNSTVNLDVCANDTALVAAAHELSLRYDETPQKEGRKQKREKSPLKEMKPNKPTGRKEKKNNSVDLESVESDPRFLDEEQQNIDDLNRAVDTALRVETTTSEKYSRIKVC